MRKNIVYIILVELAVVAIIAGLWLSYRSGAPKREAHTDLALCLERNGTIFYGAFWCPNCAEQKTLFGSAAKKLPYVECSTPDGNGQIQQCIDVGIERYPTWDFSDGTRCGGTVPAALLAQLSGCALPDYEGASVGVEELYSEIVESRIRDSLERQGETEEKITETLETTRNEIFAGLQLWHQKDWDTVTPNELLDVISKMVYQCGPIPSPEAALGEGIEITEALGGPEGGIEVTEALGPGDGIEITEALGPEIEITGTGEPE